jgi:hypothetical protein
VKAIVHLLRLIVLVSILQMPAEAAPTNSVTHMRLKIKLYDGWRQATNTNGPATFYRGQSDNPLQVSWAEYRGQKPLRSVSTDELKDAAMRFGCQQGFGELTESSGGPCEFGSYGTAIFHSTTHPRIQVWFVTDGRDHILATHICSKAADPAEVREVQEIIARVTLASEGSK